MKKYKNQQGISLFIVIVLVLMSMLASVMGIAHCAF